MHKCPGAEIINLLQDERRALLAGDFDWIAGIADRKEQLAQDMQTQITKASVVEQIHDLSLRNHELLKAAMAGIAQARARLSDIATVRQGLSTYDRKGQRALHSTDTGRLTKNI